MRDYGLAAPHGPNPAGGHVATATLGDMSNAESSVFRSLLLPDDSYDETGTYWADLPLGRKIAFVNKVNNAEAKSELQAIGRMVKADPLSPVGYYVRNMIIPGMGLLLEGYVCCLESTNSVLTMTQLCALLHRQCHTSSRICLPGLLVGRDCLRSSMDTVHYVSRSNRYHRWPDSGWYCW
jgi:hypothetical protein